MQHLFEATLTESTPERRFRRPVTLEDAIGVGSGPQTERTAMLVRAFETQHDVLERYYGSWVAVAIALVDQRGREQIELAVRAGRAAGAERRGDCCSARTRSTARWT